MSISFYTELLKAQGGTCFYCNRALTNQRQVDSRGKVNGYTRDHFLPKSQGFTALKGNVVLACVKCNMSKSNQIPGPLMCLKYFEVWSKLQPYFQREISDVYSEFFLTAKVTLWLTKLLPPRGIDIYEFEEST